MIQGRARLARLFLVLREAGFAFEAVFSPSLTPSTDITYIEYKNKPIFLHLSCQVFVYIMVSNIGAPIWTIV